MDVSLLSVALLLAALLLAVWALGWRPYRHWERRGVPSLRPRLPFLGCTWRAMAGIEPFPDLIKRVYDFGAGLPVIGFFEFLSPALMVRDPEIIKQVTVKEFDHFTDHQPFISENFDPFFSKNLFSLKGQRWREMRATLSPAFTGSKLRALFPLITACGRQLTEHVRREHEKEGGREPVTLELRDLYTRFTNDVIATTAFGVEVDSLQQPQNTFYRMGRAITQFRMWVFGLWMCLPRIMEKLGVRLFDAKATAFFDSLVHDTIRERQRRGIVRPDMLQIMMQARAGELKSDPGEEAEVAPDRGRRVQLSDEEITAQAIIFFFAGFDTVANAMGFCTYALATHPEVQARLRAEVDEALRQGGGELSYEAVQGLKYLDMVVSEALRVYPPGVGSDRLCVSPVTITLDDGSSFRFEKGDVLSIPAYGLHRDPQYWPDPERFDPERFSDENKASIQPFTYMPFGVGPRICIGQRFALLELKIALVYLVAEFDLLPSPRTPVPVRYTNAGGFNVQPTGDGFKFRFRPRAAAA